MNQISKLPNRTLGNFAFAGSLFLHVGLIAIFSSWQWDPMVPKKAPPKIVQVRFIPTPPPSQSTETANDTKRASIPPARPLTTQPNSKSHFAPRNPSLSTPALPSVQMARQMIRSHGKSIKPLPTQPIFLASTQLDSAVTPVSTRSAGQPRVVQPKFQVLLVRSSNTPITLAKTAFPMNALKSEPDPIHPLAGPIQSQSDTSSDRPTAQIPKQYPSTETSETHFAALPRQPISPNPYEPENNTVDLGNLRGLFTGQVRQRIANAKYYPRIARRRGMEGQPIIAFTLDKEGRLVKAALSQTSGYQLLDDAALDAVQQGAPYPEIPAPLKMESFQFKLPISFILK